MPGDPAGSKDLSVLPPPLSAPKWRNNRRLISVLRDTHSESVTPTLVDLTEAEYSRPGPNRVTTGMRACSSHTQNPSRPGDVT